jgi:dTDP-4-amino-4,6-dideoxygalactose transaminase
MSRVDAFIIRETSTLRDVLAVIDRGGSGLALLVDDENRLRRTITDGDVRRLLLGKGTLDDSVAMLEPQAPHTLPAGSSRRAALEEMRTHSINFIPLVDDEGRVVEVWTRAALDEPILLSTPHMGEEERQFVEQAFTSNWIAPLGPNVDAFEAELAAKVGIGHAAAVSSGTAAIHLALRLLDVGPGDRVFCSSLTFAASANPIVYQGAEPVFIDAERRSWNMCPAALERALEHARREGRLPKAVIVVNLYGQSADMDPIFALTDRYGIPVVEDAAESLGALYKGRASGTFGRMGIFSFNGNKIITTSGGGMLVSDDESLIAKARFLATQARDPAPHYQHSEIGYNYRMSNILAGVGRGQLKVLDDRVASRRRIFDMYREGLAGCDAIEWMPEPEWSRGTRWLSVGLVATLRDRTNLIHGLAEDLIEARPVWKPMHLQPVFAEAPFFSAENRPASDELFERGICLPSGSNMTDAQVGRIVEALRAALSIPA